MVSRNLPSTDFTIFSRASHLGRAKSAEDFAKRPGSVHGRHADLPRISPDGGRQACQDCYEGSATWYNVCGCRHLLPGSTGTPALTAFHPSLGQSTGPAAILPPWPTLTPPGTSSGTGR